MRSEAKKAADKRYRQSDKGKATMERYRQSEKGKATAKAYDERRKALYKIWCESEAGIASNKRSTDKYRDSEHGKAVNKKYIQSDAGRAMAIRKIARHKKMGFEMINNWFDGCDGHHINREEVLHIPAELHKSIPHRQSNPESMQLINDASYEWLNEEINLGLFRWQELVIA